MIQVGQQQVNGGARMGILAEPMTIHYAAVTKDGMWHEMGDRILPGKEPVFIFEKNLKCVRDQDWLRPTHLRFLDRKSTRLNSSHQIISYAVFCLKKKRSYSSIEDSPDNT